MSQPDLTAQLRGARPVVPAELRELVASIAAQAAPEPRRRRDLLAARALRRGAGHGDCRRSGGPPALRRHDHDLARAVDGRPRPPRWRRSTSATAVEHRSRRPRPPAPGRSRPASRSRQPDAGRADHHDPRAPRQEQPGRLRRHEAGRRDHARRSAATRRRSTSTPSSAPATRTSSCASRSRTCRRPSTRLSALGTIIGENVAIKDIQSQVDATTRKIERLVAQRAAWEKQAQTDRDPGAHRGAHRPDRQAPPRPRTRPSATRASRPSGSI